MAAKKKQKKAKNQPAKDIAKVEQKKNDELSDEQLDKVAGGTTNIQANASGPAGGFGFGGTATIMTATSK